jgi:hypothetical protein
MTIFSEIQNLLCMQSLSNDINCYTMSQMRLMNRINNCIFNSSIDHYAPHILLLFKELSVQAEHYYDYSYTLFYNVLF